MVCETTFHRKVQSVSQPDVAPPPALYISYGMESATGVMPLERRCWKCSKSIVELVLVASALIGECLITHTQFFTSLFVLACCLPDW